MSASFNGAKMVQLGGRVWGPQNHSLSTRTEARFGTNGSKSIKLEDLVWFDHENNCGGGYRDLFKLAHGRFPTENGYDQTKFYVPAGLLRELGAPVAWWDYQDETGTIIARVVRFQPAGKAKTFRQCRPNGDGWEWATRGLQLPLYRLPELLKAPAGTICYITEGEKHAAQLRDWGLLATTNAGGAKKFRPDHAKILAHFTCIIMPDNDVAGREHEAVVSVALRAAGCQNVRVLNLPGLPDKGDVINWVADGGTARELKELTARALVGDKPPPGTEPAGAAQLRKLLSVESWAARDIPEPDRLLGDLITKTTRMFLVGRTGLGKTLLGIAIAAGVASGQGFLHWRSSRPARVLYLDGEMPAELIKPRAADAMRRLGAAIPAENLLIFGRDIEAEARRICPSLPLFGPLNTDEGRLFMVALLAAIGGVDLVIFDNVMSLISGNMKDEESWLETLPLVAMLTDHQIGQLWLDHTGHNSDRQYGTSTKAWRFDAVGVMTPLADEKTDPRITAFSLSFEHPGKARRRTPDNWQDFETCTIRLRDDCWSSETPTNRALGRSRVTPMGQQFHRALLDALVVSAIQGQTTRKAWFEECERLGLVPPLMPEDSHTQREAKRKIFRKYLAELKAADWIGVDGQIVRSLVGTPP